MMSGVDGNSARFRGFNEAITEKMCGEIFARDVSRLTEVFSGSRDRDWIFSTYSYPQEASVLELVIFQVAKKTGRDSNEIWKECRRGMLNGDIRHLKEVDRVYGPGSLRFLSVMGAGKDDAVISMPEGHPNDFSIWAVDAARSFREYFGLSGRSYEHRYRIVRDVFNERELDRFKKENSQ